MFGKAPECKLALAVSRNANQHWKVENEHRPMWVRLNDDEIALILNSIPAGELAARLKVPPHPHSKAFADAVVTNDELEVDSDTVISPGDNGAFVMSWVWVYNHQAGIADDFGDEDLDLSGPGAM